MGICDKSPSLVIWFGLMLGATTGRYDDAWRIARLGYELAQREGMSTQKPMVCLVFSNLINFWRHHVRTNLPYLEEGLEAARQFGDLPYLCILELHLFVARFLTGTHLAELEVESGERLKRVRDLGFGEIADTILKQASSDSVAAGEDTCARELSSTAECDEAELETRLKQSPVSLGLSWYYVDKLQAAFIAGQFERAIAAGRAAGPLLPISRMFPVIAEHVFFFALSLAAAARPGKPMTSDDAKIFESCCEQLRRWAESCPENFSHQHALVSAEWARLRGDDVAAMHNYERAIRGAQNNGFVHTGDRLRDRRTLLPGSGLPQFADTYLREARRCFALVGSDGEGALAGAAGRDTRRDRDHGDTSWRSSTCSP